MVDAMAGTIIVAMIALCMIIAGVQTFVGTEVSSKNIELAQTYCHDNKGVKSLSVYLISVKVTCANNAEFKIDV